MADSKIDFTFENLHFACEGDNAWVEKQLNNVLNRIPSLLAAGKIHEGVVEQVIDVEDVPEVAVNVKTRKPRRKKADANATVPAENLRAEEEPTVKTKPAKAPKEAKAAKPKRKAKRKKSAAGKRKAAAGQEKKAKNAVVQDSETTIVTESPLSKFIIDKKADKNQVKRFLATAVFIARSNGKDKLTTSMITKALKSYGLGGLHNASDCLNKNEKSGYCLKDGKEFSITEKGFGYIGD